VVPDESEMTCPRMALTTEPRPTPPGIRARSAAGDRDARGSVPREVARVGVDREPASLSPGFRRDRCSLRDRGSAALHSQHRGSSLPHCERAAHDPRPSNRIAPRASTSHRSRIEMRLPRGRYALDPPLGHVPAGDETPTCVKPPAGETDRRLGGARRLPHTDASTWTARAAPTEAFPESLRPRDRGHAVGGDRLDPMEDDSRRR
jgi:hypothetical protein